MSTIELSLSRAGAEALARGADRLLERYEILRPLGRGAVGEVWLARHRRLGTLVAIKGTSARDAKTKRALERRAIARLSLPNIVALFELGVDCFVMAYIDGPDVPLRLARSPIAPGQAVEWNAQVASALAQAHARSSIAT